MKIIRRDPTNWFTPFMQWPAVFDEDLFDRSQDLTVYETDNDLVIKANVAGVPADKVDVSMESGVVTIRASVEETEEEKKARKVVYREARSARYVYTTSIPCPIKEDKAVANVKDGILTLTLPKAEEAKPKKVKVLTTKA